MKNNMVNQYKYWWGFSREQLHTQMTRYVPGFPFLASLSITSENYLISLASNDDNKG